MEPIIWLVILAFLLAIEAATAGLTTIWFAGGALVSAVAAYLGADIWLQILLFLGVSILLLIFTRPLAVRYMNKNLEKTNVNSLIGKKAVVTREIHNLAQTGQVRINDVEWMARSLSDEEIIPADTIVRIEEIRGVTLYVKEFKED
ncbi:MAG TPA: NfeD family protein [Candidatus Blautia faecigallinarum]|uniref:NfeD family protein n=1 Tax=Candidatus Blautia faecigallinarum TaxID=2838488 RepID=A0A9D2DVE7_9FIRM|nr:NfeD family protein [Candidatus Blautia faecigallinarum]